MKNIIEQRKADIDENLKSMNNGMIFNQDYTEKILGNLRLEDIVKEEYLEKVSNFLIENGFQRKEKCDDIDKQLGNYHIYDLPRLPRLMIICDEEKMKDFIKFLKEEDLVGKAFIGQVGLSFGKITK